MTAAEMLSKLRDVGMEVKDVPHHSTLRRASVLVPLFVADNGDLHLLLTQRPLHLKSHPGEVCFPGGKQDPEDAGDDIQTALRETKEEVGLESASIEILCRLRTIESLHHLCVTPIVGFIENAATVLFDNGNDDTRHNPAEVEATFHAPLALFHRPPLQQYAVEWSGESFIMRHYEHEFLHPISSKRQVYAITGLTAHIAHQVAELVFGTTTTTTTTGRLLAVSTSSTRASRKSVVSSTPIAAAATFRSHSGDVWMQQQSSLGRRYWNQRYLVLDHGSVLHLYDNAAQAQRKSNSANKKNRLLLRKDDASCRVDVPPDDTQIADKKTFVVSALDGQVEWHLAGATSAERTNWVDAIAAATR